jgi:hypothetical protein
LKAESFDAVFFDRHNAEYSMIYINDGRPFDELDVKTIVLIREPPPNGRVD